MIKLFRKMRQRSLFMEKQPNGQGGMAGNYFKYAIGEIVLVVIGILIALSINNWKEDKSAIKLTNPRRFPFSWEFA
jgi:uncharacterized membrane protein YidH (DUF202 family)